MFGEKTKVSLARTFVQERHRDAESRDEVLQTARDFRRRLERVTFERPSLSSSPATEST